METYWDVICSQATRPKGSRFYKIFLAAAADYVHCKSKLLQSSVVWSLVMYARRPMRGMLSCWSSVTFSWNNHTASRTYHSFTSLPCSCTVKMKLVMKWLHLYSLQKMVVKFNRYLLTSYLILVRNIYMIRNSEHQYYTAGQWMLELSTCCKSLNSCKSLHSVQYQ